jgi:hypothetical protein
MMLDSTLLHAYLLHAHKNIYRIKYVIHDLKVLLPQILCVSTFLTEAAISLH